MAKLINKIREMESIPKNESPFIYDAYHMGTYIGSNVCIMYEKHSHEIQRYIIVIDIQTGERIRISLTD